MFNNAWEVLIKICSIYTWKYFLISLLNWHRFCVWTFSHFDVFISKYSHFRSIYFEEEIEPLFRQLFLRLILLKPSWAKCFFPHPFYRNLKTYKKSNAIKTIQYQIPYIFLKTTQDRKNEPLSLVRGPYWCIKFNCLFNNNGKRWWSLHIPYISHKDIKISILKYFVNRKMNESKKIMLS